MRYVLAFLLLLVAPLAMAQDLVARQGNDSVRLMEAPCTNELVTPRLPPGLGEEFHAATAVFQGQMFVACWRAMGNAVLMIYEDGDQGVIPMKDLKPEMGA